MYKLSKRAKIVLTILVFEDIHTPEIPYNLIITHLNKVYSFLNDNLKKVFVTTLLRQSHVRIPDFYEKWISNYLNYDFYMHFRMSRETTQKLLTDIGAKYTPKRGHGGIDQIDLYKSLLITVWYLAKGDTIISIADRFNVSLSTVYNVTNKIIYHICELKKKYIKWPDTDEEKISVSEQFIKLEGYPGVIGAIDGTHITCKVPEQHHDSYQDRKFNHSIVLQGVCTAKKIFTNICVGFPGLVHDARVLRESTLGQTVTKHGTTYLFGDNVIIII